MKIIRYDGHLFPQHDGGWVSYDDHAAVLDYKLSEASKELAGVLERLYRAEKDRDVLLAEVREIRPALERAEKERDVLKAAMCSLCSTVSEQQHTLASMGWHTAQVCSSCNVKHTIDAGLQWSAAGARRYQYNRVEDAMRDAFGAIKGTPTNELANRTEELVKAAVQACTLGHSDGCKCVCCRVVQLAESRAATDAAGALKGGGE